MATTKKTAKKAVKKTAATPKKVVAKAKKAADQPKKKAVAAKKPAPAATKKAVATKKVATKATAAKKAVPAASKTKKAAVAKKVAVKKAASAKKATTKATTTKKTTVATASKTKKAAAAKKVAVKKAVPAKKAAVSSKAKTAAAPKKTVPKKVEKKPVAKATPAKKTTAVKKAAVQPKKETTIVTAKATNASSSKSTSPTDEKKTSGTTGGRLNRRKGKETEASAPVIARRISGKASKNEKESEHDLVMETFKPETKSILDSVNENSGPVYRYSDEDLNEFKELILKRLENARKELVYLQGLITRKDEAGTEDTDNRFNHMEDGSGAMEREQLSQLAGRQIQFISHLENALVRIENKTYGICRVTGKLIDKARLRAVPHATLSIEAKMSMKK